MHQPLSYFPWAPIVCVCLHRSAEPWARLARYLHSLPWKLVFYISPASLPSSSLPVNSSSVSPPLLSLSTLWTPCISFISTHIVPTLSSAEITTAHPQLCNAEFWEASQFLLNFNSILNTNIQNKDGVWGCVHPELRYLHRVCSL